MSDESTLMAKLAKSREIIKETSRTPKANTKPTMQPKPTYDDDYEVGDDFGLPPSRIGELEKKYLGERKTNQTEVVAKKKSAQLDPQEQIENIKNSRLPDAIKNIMISKPIVFEAPQPVQLNEAEIEKSKLLMYGKPKQEEQEVVSRRQNERPASTEGMVPLSEIYDICSRIVNEILEAKNLTNKQPLAKSTKQPLHEFTATSELNNMVIDLGNVVLKGNMKVYKKNK